MSAPLKFLFERLQPARSVLVAVTVQSLEWVNDEALDGPPQALNVKPPKSKSEANQRFLIADYFPSM
jgi:hypothetical protein